MNDQPTDNNFPRADLLLLIRTLDGIVTPPGHEVYAVINKLRASFSADEIATGELGA